MKIISLRALMCAMALTTGADDMRVLAVQERLVSGPIDWTDWLARMKAYSGKK